MKVDLVETKMPLPSKDNDKEYANVKLNHICEVCGVEKWLTPEEGFAEGWDYASRMYPFKVISPRTCGNCGGIEGTAWYEICVKHKRFDELTDKQKQTVMRIYNEPNSIMATEEQGGNKYAGRYKRTADQTVSIRCGRDTGSEW